MPTDARLHAILARHRPHAAARAEFRHFEIDDGRPVPAETVTDEPGWTLYSLDRDRRAALFLEMPETLDLAEAPFSYTAQFTAARRALVVPAAALPRLAARIDPPRRLAFLFSIGRCRSTLAAKLLGGLPGVWCLGEPDAFMNLAMDRHRYQPGEMRDLVAACVRLCYRPPAGRNHAAYIVQPRSQALFLADAFHAAHPAAACLFVYRDAEAWAQSIWRMLLRLGLPVATADREARAFIWRTFTADSPPAAAMPGLDLGAELVHAEQVLAAAWVAQIERYLADLGRGVPYHTFHHDELDGSLGTVERMVAACGLDPGGLPAAMAAFGRDSQADTALAHDPAQPSFDSLQRQRVQAVIAAHPLVATIARRLPDASGP